MAFNSSSIGIIVGSLGGGLARIFSYDAGSDSDEDVLSTNYIPKGFGLRGDDLFLVRYANGEKLDLFCVDFLSNGAATLKPVETSDSDAITISRFGAKGDGVTDDTAAFLTAAATGKVISLDADSRYRITRRIDFTGGGLVGPRSAVILPDVDYFTNTSTNIILRYGTNAVVLAAQGELVSPYSLLDYILFRGFTIDMQNLGGNNRYISAIVARSINNLDIQDVEIRNFPGSSGGIKIASIMSGNISKNYIHDFSGYQEYSGIEIDNDELNAVPSRNLIVSDNIIDHLLFSEAGFDANGYEPNGIKCVGQNSFDLSIRNNVLSYMGQGIDIYAQHSKVCGNVISYCIIDGIALKHGASYNDVGNNVITYSGIWGIVLVGDASPHSTTFNHVHDNIVMTVGYSEWVDFIDYSADISSEFATILTWPDHTTSNNVIGNNTLIPGTTLVARSVAQARKGFSDQTNHWSSNFCVAGTLGITYKPNSEAGINSPISTAASAFVNDSSGAETVAFSTANHFSVIGSATVINMNATNNLDDSLRPVQLVAINNSGANTVDFEIRTPAGSSATAKLKVTGAGNIVMPTLPTSSAGLAAGMLWNNSGTVKIV